MERLNFNLDKVMAFQPPELLVERFSQDYNIPSSEVIEQFDEVKKFLVVCASDRSTRFAPSKTLDKMWHDFVIFTPEYVRFCDTIGGYVHHRPTREIMHQSYANTLEAMPRIFGDVNLKYWKTRSAADCDSQCDDDGYCDDAPCDNNASLQ